MSTTYPTRYDEMLTAAYGPFLPGSDARAIRTENARRGLRTCWNPSCLRAFAPERVTDADGRLHRPGSGHFYCSRSCARADRRSRRRSSGSVISVVGGELVIDLRRLRMVSA